MGGDKKVYSVLHVDDDPGLTNLTSDLSEDEDNLDLDTLNNPEEALEYVEDGSYDALILDYEMPGMNGRELWGDVRESYGEFPVVFYSSRDNVAEEIYAEARDEAMVDFVEKDGVVTDLTELRHSVVQTVEYSEKADQVRQLKKRARNIVSNARHDILNPLGVAKGFSEILENYDFDLDWDINTKITSQLYRVEEIVDDAVDLAEGVSISEDDLERVELDEAAEDSWDHLEPSQNGEKPDIDVRDMGEVEADESRLKNLFTNLYCNAVDHSGMEVGELKLEVGELTTIETSTRAPTQPKGFYIEDNGQGIPRDKKSEVFEQGFTTGETNTGYGLATVKEIAKQHGWEIEVTESTKGGARFEFKIR